MKRYIPNKLEDMVFDTRYDRELFPDEVCNKLNLYSRIAEESKDSLSLQVMETVRLRKALEFYANPENYINETIDGYPVLIHKEQLESGKLARQVLKKIDET